MWSFARAHLVHLCDRARLPVVDGDEVVGAEEEVGVVRGEVVLAGLEVDAVQDQVEVAVVRLDLRDGGTSATRVLDGQRVEVEGVGEDRETPPSVGAARSTQHTSPRCDGSSHARLDGVGLLGDAVAVDEDGDHQQAPDYRAPGASACAQAPGRQTQARSPEPGAWSLVQRQSPTFTCSAACAAARRATGTRYGEALT